MGELGTIIPPNLMPGGPLKDWSDGEIIRAIRELVHKTGRPLLIMPSDVLHNLSDADVQARVAHLRSQSAVNHDTPNNEVDLVKTFRTGIDSNGHVLNPDQLPYKQFSAAFSDDELKAIYQYLHGLGPQ